MEDKSESLFGIEKINEYLEKEFFKNPPSDIKIMEAELKFVKESGLVPRILLHSCCAPCSSHCISVLHKYFHITVLYYNPNIEPYEEYLKRKEEEIRFISQFPTDNGIDLMDCDYDNEKFHEIAKGLEDCPERGKRCYKCYEQRIEKTAYMAKESGYDFFASTLTLSPYKNSKWVNEIGKRMEEKYGVVYLTSDFKKKNGYKHSIELSEEYGLYRQDYCGCIYSKR